MADPREVRPAGDLGIGVALNAGADEAEVFEVLQPGQLLQPGIRQLAIVDDPKRLEVRQFSNRGDPFIIDYL